MGKFLKIVFLLLIFIIYNQCSDNSASDISRGHRDAIKYECKSDPDEKLCGKEVRLRFKRNGHEYVTFEDLSKEQTNRVVTNCIMDKKYGLISYNDCLSNNKTLALGGEITPGDDPPITSHTDRIKSYTFHIMAYWKDKPPGGSVGSSGTGVAIEKNLIATNCHVVSDLDHSFTNKKQIFYDTIVVKNLLDDKKIGKVQLLKDQWGHFLDVDICLLKTKTDLKYVKKKIKYSSLKQTDSVRALGNPKGIVGHTSLGRITALENWDYYMNDPLTHPYKYPITVKIIHHDAAIGQGSSGGPLFDVGGNLIGFNTYAVSEGTTGGFGIAISADHIEDVLAGKLSDF